MKYCYIFSVLLDAVAETLLFAHVNQPRFTSTSSVLYVYYASCDWLNLIRILIDYCFDLPEDNRRDDISMSNNLHFAALRAPIFCS